jgi:hypothetical protein
VFAQTELSVPVHTFASAKSVGIGLMTAFGAAIGRPLLAGKRLLVRRSRPDFGLLGDLKSVVDLDPEVPHGAFRMTKEQLHGS